jgi:hypothetical protein
MRGELTSARRELDTLRARSERLEVDLGNARREGEAALEAERVKRGLEIDTLVEQQQAALVAARAEGGGSRGGPVRDALAKMVKTLEEVDQLDSEARALRAGVLDQARRALSTTTALPVKTDAITQTAITIPPITKRKRSKRPPVPPPPPLPATPITTPGEKLESFDDLELE